MEIKQTINLTTDFEKVTTERDCERERGGEGKRKRERDAGCLTPSVITVGRGSEVRSSPQICC